jgi:hypothetical protein
MSQLSCPLLFITFDYMEPSEKPLANVTAPLPCGTAAIRTKSEQGVSLGEVVLLVLGILDLTKLHDSCDVLRSQSIWLASRTP